MILVMAAKNTISTGPMAGFIESLRNEKDIISCFSFKTLRTIVNKIEQLTIIIDFDDIQSRDIDTLREYKHSSNHLVLLTITTNDYQYIKEIATYDWFDDFILKPFNQRDLGTRMLIMQNRHNRNSMMNNNGKIYPEAMVAFSADSSPAYDDYNYRDAPGNEKVEKDFVEAYYDFEQDKRKEFGYFIDTDPLKDVFKDHHDAD